MADDFRSIIRGVLMDINQIDMPRLYDMLKGHEGEKLTCYYDSLGNETVGIGHLCNKSNPLTLEIGDSISQAHSLRLFENDIQQSIKDCRKLYGDFDTYPLVCKEALINMMFNMGYTHMRSFTGFNETIQRQDWGVVADFLRNNFKKWYSQVGNRARDIEDMFRKAARGI